MLIVLQEQHRTGSTDVDEQDVAVHPATIHRMVPHDKGTVRATFEDGEQITLVGDVRGLVKQINRSCQQGYEQL